jgi:cytidine deaminase
VLVLVSGAGQPRNAPANPADNSTEGTGRVIERFVKLVYPDIEVVHIPSAFGIFRYDDNVRFVKEQVLPAIEARRAEVVASHGDTWSSNLKITVSLADGAPARISAINAAMRSYRPDYLHVWRMKTFWDTRTLSEEDVEWHSFKKLEMRPAMHRTQLREVERGLVDEMVRYKRQFEAVRDSNSHELESFWLRKTGKVVLAVLLTKSADDKYTYWRGLNVEVSMPTGTLCAERNAIGNALAADQSVRRSDMLAVAVLSMSLQPGTSGSMSSDPTSGHDYEEIALNPLDPCGACMEWLKKIAEVNPDFKVSFQSVSPCRSAWPQPERNPLYSRCSQPYVSH